MNFDDPLLGYRNTGDRDRTNGYLYDPGQEGTGYKQEPIARRSVQLSIIATEHVHSNRST